MVGARCGTCPVLRPDAERIRLSCRRLLHRCTRYGYWGGVIQSIGRNTMSSPSSDSNEAARSLSPVKGNSILRGVLIGLIPLGLLVGIIVIILVLTALTRQ